MATAKGWASLFAPLRAAWDVLGPVRPELARAWGLPASCRVHVGVHDSNACLARYFDAGKALTVVSSGTWTVLMAPGAPTASLQAERDMLGNVDVLGRATPTARFMGGREFAALLDGAAPGAATVADSQKMLTSQTMAMPSFAREGGPFKDHVGWIQRGGQRLNGTPSQWLTVGERSALAALYCAQVPAFLVDRLWADTAPSERTVIVEGPLSQNALYLSVLQKLLPDYVCYCSHDALEGTARGAWLLCHWQDGPRKTTWSTRRPVTCRGCRSTTHSGWLCWPPEHQVQRLSGP